MRHTVLKLALPHDSNTDQDHSDMGVEQQMNTTQCVYWQLAHLLEVCAYPVVSGIYLGSLSQQQTGNLYISTLVQGCATLQLMSHG